MWLPCKVPTTLRMTGEVSRFAVLPFPNFKINLDVPPLVSLFLAAALNAVRTGHCIDRRAPRCRRSQPTPLILNPIGQDQLSISVTSPTAVGQGMRSYTAYKVSTVTTFEYFPRKEMTVMRRFSDFLWLHEMLCSQYAGTSQPQRSMHHGPELLRGWLRKE